MKRQNMAWDALTRAAAKGKRQKAKVDSPAASPPPVSKPIDAASPQKNDNPIIALAAPESANAMAVENSGTTQKSSTPFDRAMRLLEQRGGLMVASIAAVLAMAAFVYFFTNGMTNHYGDGIAHVNIARKVVDSPDSSLWQRYLQIGTPWLPLQTVLMLPLVANDRLWRSGAAGSLVSMIAFVIAATMIFQIARHLYREEDARLAVWMPATTLAIFALNPSALFMQTTPMTETIFMAAIAAAVFYLQQWVKAQTTKRLMIAGIAMTIATLARYEAWPVAALAALIVALAGRGSWKARTANTAVFAAVVAIAPLYWLWHNWAIFGNALEFLSGPHSARGIFLHEEARLGWAKVFIGHPFVSLLWMTVTTAVCAGPFILLLGAVGFVAFT